MNAALSAEGAVSGHSGSLGVHVTAGPQGPVPGVVAVARADGRYDVGLHLVAEPVSLYDLAERVRELVLQWAKVEELAPLVGRIDVSFEDVVARIPLELPFEGRV